MSTKTSYIADNLLYNFFEFCGCPVIVICSESSDYLYREKLQCVSPHSNVGQYHTIVCNSVNFWPNFLSSKQYYDNSLFNKVQMVPHPGDSWWQFLQCLHTGKGMATFEKMLMGWQLIHVLGVKPLQHLTKARFVNGINSIISFTKQRVTESVSSSHRFELRRCF